MIDSPRPHLFLKEGDHDTTRRDNFTRIVRGARPNVQALLGGARGRSPPTSAVMHRSNTVTPLWGDKLAESSHARNDATAYAATPLRGTTRRLAGQQKGPGSFWACSQEFHPVLPTGFATPIRPKKRNRPAALDSHSNIGTGTPV